MQWLFLRNKIFESSVSLRLSLLLVLSYFLMKFTFSIECYVRAIFSYCQLIKSSSQKGKWCANWTKMTPVQVDDSHLARYWRWPSGWNRFNNKIVPIQSRNPNGGLFTIRDSVNLAQETDLQSSLRMFSFAFILTPVFILFCQFFKWITSYKI